MQGNSKLNMAFVANLFNNFPGLPPMDEEEQEQEEEEPYEETREDLSKALAGRSSRLFAGPGHVTYPPLNLRHGSL